MTDCRKIQTKIVAAFPGAGKTYYTHSEEQYMPQGWCIDSDSSKFDKSDFPRNYIEHIKAQIGKVAIVFVSSHKQVRDALLSEGIWFTLIYPEVDLKSEYINRYEKRGNSAGFISLVDSNWDSWIAECKSQTECDHIVLKSGQFVSNVI